MSLDYDLARADQIRVTAEGLAKVSETIRLLDPFDSDSQEILSVAVALLATSGKERRGVSPVQGLAPGPTPEHLFALAEDLRDIRALIDVGDPADAAVIPMRVTRTAHSLTNFAEALAARRSSR